MESPQPAVAAPVERPDRPSLLRPTSSSAALPSARPERRLRAPGLPFVLALVLALACGPSGDEGSSAGAPGDPGPGEPPVAATEPPPGPWFVERTAEAGLDFVHFNGAAGAWAMPENMGGGGALLDVDGDGDLDLYLVQGQAVGPGATTADALFPPRHREPLTDRLYRNDTPPGGPLRFVDITDGAGLPEACQGMGAATGDVDGDGDLDLYVTCFGPNRLLENRGDGTFRVVPGAGGAQDGRWSVPAAFFDPDGDGDLDLFVGTYLDFRYTIHRPCATAAGTPDYCDPATYDPLPDRLFENRGGDGLGAERFVDASPRLGLEEAPGKALGVLVLDADGDGFSDLYVANDGTPNHLWLTGGDLAGPWSEEALLAGLAVNAEGLSEAGMGVDAGDVDGDGDLDLVLTHFTGETHTLYRAEGDALFEDATFASGTGLPDGARGLGPASLEANGFGAVWSDVDLDGRLDLVTVNGAVRSVEELVLAGDPYPFGQADLVFWNAGDGRLMEATEAAGAVFSGVTVSRGLVAGDLDGDGDEDLVVVDNAGPARLLENVAADGAPWLGIELVPAVRAQGAVVELLRPGRASLVRRAGTDGSYASGRDPRVLFGLAGPGAGAGSSVDAGAEGPFSDGPFAVRVRWSDGTVEEFEDLEPGAYRRLEHGAGQPARAGAAGGGS